MCQPLAGDLRKRVARTTAFVVRVFSFRPRDAAIKFVRAPEEVTGGIKACSV
jgi:hypothetical protein